MTTGKTPFSKRSCRQEYNVTVSGATDKTDYFISAGYLSDPSYFVSSKFNRYNLRSNVSTQIDQWLKAGVNIAYSRRAQQSMATRWGRNPGTTDYKTSFIGSMPGTPWPRCGSATRTVR